MLKKFSKEQKQDFEGLAFAQCSKREIARYFKLTLEALENACQETFYQSFDEVYQHLAAVGRNRLRKQQLNLAKRNPGGS